MTSRMYRDELTRTQALRAQPAIAMLIALTLANAPQAIAQSTPGTPVFEAVGYGVVRPMFEMHRPIGAAKREADAGGGAEFATLPDINSPHRVERWKVTPDGVPYLAGYVPTAHAARSATWADVDEDGVADLVCGEADGAGAFVEIFHMGPSGPVAPGRLLSLPPLGTAGYLMVADVNGDGHPDIGVVNAEATYQSNDFGRMFWLLSDGAGSYALSNSGTYAGQPMVARLGPGAISDLMDWDPQSLFTRPLHGAGDGTFAGAFPEVFYEASGRPFVTDLDHDGLLDVVAGRFLYRSNADGSLTEVDSLAANTTAMVDIDHDGTNDLVAVQNGKIRVARGLGGFSFTPFTDYTAGSIVDGYFGFDFMTRGPYGMSAVMDANGDGWTDVLGTSTGGSVVYAIPGQPGGRFHQPYHVATGNDPVQVALADVMGSDGKLDLVVLARGSRKLELRTGAGDGTFGPAQILDLPAGGRRMVIADLNADGRLDMAVACDTAQTIRVFPGTVGGFGAAFDLAAAESLTDLVAADVDEDGHLDLVAATASGGIAAWRGDGAFGFSATDWSAMGPPSDGLLRLADMDGDGHLDLVAAEHGAFPKMLGCGRGDGHGHFGYASTADYFGAHARFETGDLLGDGRTFVAYVVPDSILWTYAFFRAFTLQGDPWPAHWQAGAVHAGENQGYEVPILPQQLAIADVTGDGIPDALVLSAWGGGLTVLAGLGGGQFDTPIVHIVGPDPTAFALGDVDGDGRPDVVVADDIENNVTVLRHLGSPTAGVAPTSAPSRLAMRVLSAPSASQLKVGLVLPEGTAAQVDVFDTMGRRLIRQRLEAGPPGARELSLDANRLPGSGVYFARLSQGSVHVTARFTRFD